MVVVWRSLLSECRGASAPGRRLALHDVLLGFLLVSKRTARLDGVPGKFCVPDLVHVALGGPFSHSHPASFAVSSAAWCFE